MRLALLPALVIVCVLLIAAGIEEHLARRYFNVSLQLEAKRDDEVRHREQTEGKLNVLSQAIGTIVYDLVNSLTSVQSGASVLQSRIAYGRGQGISYQAQRHRAGRREKMLSFLRLSLYRTGASA